MPSRTTWPPPLDGAALAQLEAIQRQYLQAKQTDETVNSSSESSSSSDSSSSSSSSTSSSVGKIPLPKFRTPRRSPLPLPAETPKELDREILERTRQRLNKKLKAARSRCSRRSDQELYRRRRQKSCHDVSLMDVDVPQVMDVPSVDAPRRRSSKKKKNACNPVPYFPPDQVLPQQRRDVVPCPTFDTPPDLYYPHPYDHYGWVGGSSLGYFGPLRSCPHEMRSCPHEKVGYMEWPVAAPVKMRRRKRRPSVCGGCLDMILFDCSTDYED